MTNLENEVLAYLCKDGERYYVTNANGDAIGDCEISKDGLSLKMPVNDANRTWITIKKAEAYFAENSNPMGLTYRATRTIGSVSVKTPNAKLVAYLSEEDQATYNAIIDRARAAMEADKVKPLSEADKLRAKIAKAQAKLDELLADED